MSVIVDPKHCLSIVGIDKKRKEALIFFTQIFYLCFLALCLGSSTVFSSRSVLHLSFVLSTVVVGTRLGVILMKNCHKRNFYFRNFFLFSANVCKRIFQNILFNRTNGVRSSQLEAIIKLLKGLNVIRGIVGLLLFLQYIKCSISFKRTK